jgi:hypothetical protein
MSAIQFMMDDERVSMQELMEQELIELEPPPVDQLIDLTPLPGPANPNSAQRFLEPFPRDMNVPVVLLDVHVPNGDQFAWEDEDSKNQ